MYTDQEFLTRIQGLYPSTPLRRAGRPYYFDLPNLPLEGLTIRIKPGSYGTFQVLFPWPGTPRYQKLNDYAMLDKYFKEYLKHAEATNFSSQIGTNKIIYIYPKYVTNLDSCVRLLSYTIQQVQNARSIIFQEQNPTPKAVLNPLKGVPTTSNDEKIANYPQRKRNKWIPYAAMVFVSLLIIKKLTSMRRRSTLTSVCYY
jgi:hypothetical protein